METVEYKGYLINIYQDTYSENPREEWNNLGTMVCFHHRYNLGDKHELTLDEAMEHEEMLDRRGDVVLPLFLYDHSGITISTSPFSCSWDSGKVGYIYVTREKIRKEYGWKRLTKARRENIESYLRSEVETYDDYLTGNVYGYIIEHEKEKNISGCSGFYGYDREKSGLLEAARNEIDSLVG